MKIELQPRDITQMGDWEIRAWETSVDFANQPTFYDPDSPDPFLPILAKAKKIVRTDLQILQTTDEEVRVKVFTQTKAFGYQRWIFKMQGAVYTKHRLLRELEKASEIKRPILANEYRQALLRAEHAMLMMELLAHRTRNAMRTKDKDEIPL